jgi:hypothetical protein
MLKLVFVAGADRVIGMASRKLSEAGPEPLE